MSSSQTAPTSTTASSGNSPSPPRGDRGGVPPGKHLEIIACGTLAGLGLDRYPELWDDYFGHYTRLVWLAQEPSPALEAEADRVAAMFGLPLTRIDTGVSRLEQELSTLVKEAS